jgi:hypothetical protein
LLFGLYDPTVNPPADQDGTALLEHLRTHDAACRACGYSLRAIPALTCPECGAALRADSIEPVPRPPLASRAFAGAQTAVLLGAFLAIFLLAFRRSRVEASPTPAAVLAGVALPALALVAMGLWLWFHARLLRVRHQTQARLMWAAAALTALEAIAAMHAGLI